MINAVVFILMGLADEENYRGKAQFEAQKQIKRLKAERKRLTDKFYILIPHKVFEHANPGNQPLRSSSDRCPVFASWTMCRPRPAGGSPRRVCRTSRWLT